MKFAAKNDKFAEKSAKVCKNTEILKKATLSKLNPRFVNVFVTGRVNRPGKIMVSKASVLSDAIIMAGGTKALKGRITFIRFNKDGTIDKRNFAYRNMLKRGGFKNDWVHYDWSK